MTINLCDKVRASCLEYYKSQHHIQIQNIPSLARRILETSRNTPIEWDSEGWHLQDSTNNRERTALYILALDSINFCFWPSSSNYEYEDLATTLTRMAPLLTATFLQDVTPLQMENLMKEHHPDGKAPPLMDERCAVWNQVGRVLNDNFEGQALVFIDASRNLDGSARSSLSAVHLVSHIVDNFPAFRDVHNQVYFLKRAQILVGDWNAALQLNLPDISRLTCFPDYRLPQLLRDEGVLLYDFIVSSIVDGKQEIRKGSHYELAIRSSTVLAVEMLVQELQKSSPDWNAMKLDWYLWQRGEHKQSKGELRPHHRVRTIYY